MDAKAEFHKVVKDLTDATREFAMWGLQYSTKALEKTGVHLKSLEESLKRTAEKLKKDGEPVEPQPPPAAPAEAAPAEEAKQ